MWLWYISSCWPTFTSLYLTGAVNHLGRYNLRGLCCLDFTPALTVGARACESSPKRGSFYLSFFLIHKPLCLPPTHVFFFLSTLYSMWWFPFTHYTWIIEQSCKMPSSRADSREAHSGQRNWWGCYLPVARACPKYHTQCHGKHVRPWKCSPCISVSTVSPRWWHHGDGDHRWWAAQSLQDRRMKARHRCELLARQKLLWNSSDFHRRAAHCAILMSMEAVLGLVGTKTPRGLGVSKSMCACVCEWVCSSNQCVCVCAVVKSQWGYTSREFFTGVQWIMGEGDFGISE